MVLVPEDPKKNALTFLEKLFNVLENILEEAISKNPNSVDCLYLSNDVKPNLVKLKIAFTKDPSATLDEVTLELDKYKALVSKLLVKSVEIKVPSGYKEAKEKLDKIPD